MNEQVRETAEALTEYANTEKEMIIKDVRKLSLLGTGAIIMYYVLDTAKLTLQNTVFETISLYCETLVYVTVLMIMAAVIAFVSALIIKLLFNSL